MDEVRSTSRPSRSQLYRIGPASCAVPGRRRPGSARRTGASAACRGACCSEPAIEHARNGVELNEPQAFLHEILDVILRHTRRGPRAVRLERQPPRRGRPAGDDRPRADARAARGARRGRPLHAASLRARSPSTCARGGGAITLRDLAEYRVIQRRPVRVAVPRPRVRLQPAALDRRHPDRARPAPLRPARHGRPARQRRGDGPARRDHARAGSGARRPVRARALPRRARASALRRGELGAAAGAHPRAAAGAAARARRTSRSSTGTATRPR